MPATSTGVQRLMPILHRRLRTVDDINPAWPNTYHTNTNPRDLVVYTVMHHCRTAFVSLFIMLQA